MIAFDPLYTHTEVFLKNIDDDDVFGVLFFCPLVKFNILVSYRHRHSKLMYFKLRKSNKFFKN